MYLLLCPASVEASRVSGLLYKMTVSYPVWPCVNSCLEKEKKTLFFPLLFAMFVPFYLLKQMQINVSLNLPKRPLGLHVSEANVHSLFHHTANEAPDGNFLCAINFIMLYRHTWLNPNVTPSRFLATVGTLPVGFNLIVQNALRHLCMGFNTVQIKVDWSIDDPLTIDATQTVGVFVAFNCGVPLLWLARLTWEAILLQPACMCFDTGLFKIVLVTQGFKKKRKEKNQLGFLFMSAI